MSKGFKICLLLILVLIVLFFLPVCPTQVSNRLPDNAMPCIGEDCGKQTHIGFVSGAVCVANLYDKLFSN